MKKIKLKLSHDALTCIMNLIYTQIITGNNYKTINPTKDQKHLSVFMVGLMTEFYSKHISKMQFSYIGDRTINMTPLQAYAFQYAMENGFFSSDNQWTRTILQVNFERVTKQLNAA